MSHFTVMVIGDNPEQQLAPFHEFECTGQNDEYVQDVDVTDECKENGLDWHGLDDKTVTDESEVDRDGRHRYGYAVVDSEGNIIKAVNRTNPNAKWDWHALGGRWTGFLKLKAGKTGTTGRPGIMTDAAKTGYADAALKRDIDIEGMRDEAGARAGRRFDHIRAIIGPHIDNFTHWEKMCNELHAGNIDTARTAYHAQPMMKALTEAKEHLWNGPDEFLVSREQYIQGARDTALTTFAVLNDGQWHERGKMGWWACVSNEKPEGEWEAELAKLIDGLPDDTMLSIYDCHI